MFALISHMRKTVGVYFKHSNSLKYLSYPSYLLVPGPLIIVLNDAVILRGWEWVGGSDRAGDRQKNSEEREI